MSLDKIVKDTAVLKKIVLDKINQEYNLYNLYPKTTTEEGNVSSNEELYLTENFLISSEGLIFAYQQYEIAPYSEGLIQVKIPYNDIQDLLKIQLN